MHWLNWITCDDVVEGQFEGLRRKELQYDQRVVVYAHLILRHADPFTGTGSFAPLSISTTYGNCQNEKFFNLLKFNNKSS